MHKARFLSPFGRSIAKAVVIVTGALAVCYVSRAHAQSLPNPSLGGNVTLSVTATEGTPTALPATPGIYPDLTIHNDGAQEVFCSVGVGTSFTVTTTSYQVAVPSKGFVGFHNPTANHVACVTASSTSTARVYQNAGASVLGNAGG